jgi:TPR repeat protein
MSHLEMSHLEMSHLEMSHLEMSHLEMSHLEMIGPGPRDLADVGVSDADDLRRLEESIRWLMTAGTAPMPRPAPLPPLIGLTPLDPRDDESLLLDPDTLFAPRSARRRSVTAGAAKILLVSAVAAPTAYFIASWLQFPGAAAPSDVAAAVATSPARTGDQVAVLDVTPPNPVPAPAPRPTEDDDAQKAPEPAAAMSPPPAAATRAVEMTVVAAVEPERPAAAAAPVAVVPAAQPATAVQPTEAANPSTPAIVVPAKPTLRREEIALMIERGRLLFEAGDVAAARLFFRRAANAGDATAAFAMGATFDPDVLAQRFIRGIEADAVEAQKWYEMARGMGGERVEMLAHR